jgi:hypothetical protein
MAHFRDADIGFSYPDDWQAHAAAGFARSTAFQAPTITVSRTPMLEGDTPHEHAQRKIVVAAMFSDFALVESGSTILGGVPGWRIQYSYRTKLGVVVQSETFVHAPADKAIMTSFLTACLQADAESLHPAFERALASVRFALPERPPRPSGGESPGEPEVPMPGSRTSRP